MANKSFSRGVETLGAEASIVFVGNTQHTVPYMLKYSDLFDELPDKFYDSAFLDRIHFYVPGWEIDIIRRELFSDGYGFVVDYLAEILRSLRNHDYSDRYKPHFELSSDISTRDSDAINKTFSGLMKILFPSGEASKTEIEEILKFATEGRKRVKDQLMRIDSTYADVDFSYTDNSGNSFSVTTLEEEQYPNHYHHTITEDDEAMGVTINDEFAKKADSKTEDIFKEKSGPKEDHLVIKENQKGVSFEKIFAPYFKEAKEITITDPYIRLFHQVRNLMELIEVIAKNKLEEDEVDVHLISVEDEFKSYQQNEFLEKIQESALNAGINFTWDFDDSGIHARHIVTDNGWKILLDRGLDVFQHYEMNDAFSLANRMQEYRSCKAFEVTFLKQ